ncbi:MAG: hypothetical protein ACP5G1_03020, partial [Nanopusillaceae archaeon]
HLAGDGLKHSYDVNYLLRVSKELYDKAHMLLDIIKKNHLDKDKNFSNIKKHLENYIKFYEKHLKGKMLGEVASHIMELRKHLEDLHRIHL